VIVQKMDSHVASVRALEQLPGRVDVKPLAITSAGRK
jgi:hypothetical protein